MSPAYVEAMTREITKRFEMGGAMDAETEAPTQAEIKEAEAGSEVWK